MSDPASFACPAEPDALAAAARPRGRRLSEVAFGAVAFAIVLVLHGLVPGWLFPSLGIPFAVMARGQSLALGGFFAYPGHFGYPFGAPVVSGLPAAMLQGILIKLTGIGPASSYQVAQALFLLAAFLGTRRLMGVFGLPGLLASAGAAIYLSSIFIIGHQGYANLMLGFALLPLSVVIDYESLRKTSPMDFRWPRALGWTAFAAFWKTSLLLTDGYSFVISAVFSCVIGGWEVCRRVRARQGAPAVGLAGLLTLSHAVAYAVYSAYVPGGNAYVVMPADFFRAQGLDLYTLFVPLNQSSLLSFWLKLKVTGHQGAEYYGDGSNAYYNYLGLVLMLAVPGAVLCWRRAPRLRPALVAAGLCLFFSLGPSLKIHDGRPPSAPGTVFTFDDYLMKPGRATLDLHTEALYRSVPGIRDMRSVYRWQVGFRFVALGLALVTVGTLCARRRLRLAGAALLVLLLVDTIPPVRGRIARYARNERAVSRFYAEVVPELRHAIPPHHLVLFVSSENDYLANPLATALDCRVYNVAGDKNTRLAEKHWPPEARAIFARQDILANAEALHRRGQLDYLVIPHFNLRWHSYTWPPTSAELKQARAAAAAIARSAAERHAVTVGKYATVIDLTLPPPAP